MDSAALAKKLGSLPEWNLADLYASPDDPAFAADLKRGEAEARRFAETYKASSQASPATSWRRRSRPMRP
jgi:oligoendopeptidase F